MCQLVSGACQEAVVYMEVAATRQTGSMSVSENSPNHVAPRRWRSRPAPDPMWGHDTPLVHGRLTVGRCCLEAPGLWSPACRFPLCCPSPKLLGQDLAHSHPLVQQVLSTCCMPGHMLGAGGGRPGSLPTLDPLRLCTCLLEWVADRSPRLLVSIPRLISWGGAGSRATR